MPPKAAQYWFANPRPPEKPGTLLVAQFWPVSHWATESQMEAAWASLAVAMPPAMVAAPATETPASRALRERRFVAAACFGV